MNPQDVSNSWETSKENVQPLRTGRNVACLQAALQPTETDMEALLLERQRFEEQILAEEKSSDPIDAWDRYLKWTQQNFPRGENNKVYEELLNSFILKFFQHEQYKNDPRYVNAWLTMLQISADPDNSFRFMKKNGIGVKCASYYVAWADECEKGGNIKRANLVYETGLKNDAQPNEVLVKMMNAFQMRAARAIAQKTSSQPQSMEIDEPSEASRTQERRALGTLQGRGSKKIVGTNRTAVPVVPKQTQQRKLIPQSSSNSRIQIFSDENANDEEQLDGKFAGLPNHKQASKENVVGDPSVWKGKKVKQRASRKTELSRPENNPPPPAPSFAIFSDQDEGGTTSSQADSDSASQLKPPPSARKVAANVEKILTDRKEVSQTSDLHERIRLAWGDKNDDVMRVYPVEKVYSVMGEFQLEEVWAARWRKQKRDEEHEAKLSQMRERELEREKERLEQEKMEMERRNQEERERLEEEKEELRRRSEREKEQMVRWRKEAEEKATRREQQLKEMFRLVDSQALQQRPEAPQQRPNSASVEMEEGPDCADVTTMHRNICSKLMQYQSTQKQQQPRQPTVQQRGRNVTDENQAMDVRSFHAASEVKTFPLPPMDKSDATITNSSIRDTTITPSNGSLNSSSKLMLPSPTVFTKEAVGDIMQMFQQPLMATPAGGDGSHMAAGPSTSGSIGRMAGPSTSRGVGRGPSTSGGIGALMGSSEPPADVREDNTGNWLSSFAKQPATAGQFAIFNDDEGDDIVMNPAPLSKFAIFQDSDAKEPQPKSSTGGGGFSIFRDDNADEKPPAKFAIFQDSDGNESPDVQPKSGTGGGFAIFQDPPDAESTAGCRGMSTGSDNVFHKPATFSIFHDSAVEQQPATSSTGVQKLNFHPRDDNAENIPTPGYKQPAKRQCLSGILQPAVGFETREKDVDDDDDFVVSQSENQAMEGVFALADDDKNPPAFLNDFSIAAEAPLYDNEHSDVIPSLHPGRGGKIANKSGGKLLDDSVQINFADRNHISAESTSYWPPARHVIQGHVTEFKTPKTVSSDDDVLMPPPSGEAVSQPKKLSPIVEASYECDSTKSSTKSQESHDLRSSHQSTLQTTASSVVNTSKSFIRPSTVGRNKPTAQTVGVLQYPNISASYVAATDEPGVGSFQQLAGVESFQQRPNSSISSLFEAGGGGAEMGSKSAFAPPQYSSLFAAPDASHHRSMFSQPEPMLNQSDASISKLVSDDTDDIVVNISNTFKPAAFGDFFDKTDLSQNVVGMKKLEVSMMRQPYDDDDDVEIGGLCDAVGNTSISRPGLSNTTFPSMGPLGHLDDTRPPSPCDDVTRGGTALVGNPRLRVVQNPWDQRQLKEDFDSTAKLEQVDYVGGKAPHVKKGTVITSGDTNYRVTSLLAEGGFANVFKATKNDENRESVVLKVQRVEGSTSWEPFILQEARRRLGRTSRLRAYLGVFPDVLACIMFDNANLVLYEYLPNGTLLNYVQNCKTYGQELGREKLGLQVMQIVHALHQVGIIHGDVKPDNFMVTGEFRDGHGRRVPTLKLIDFGRAIDISTFLPNTVFKQSCGTSGFECLQMQHDQPWNYHIDLYGVAGTVYVCNFGRYMKPVQSRDGVWTVPERRISETWTTFYNQLLNFPTPTSEFCPGPGDSPLPHLIQLFNNSLS